ncbi:Hsp70 family protein [Lentzea sp. BCCO 10_0798]|uniref:Hsp70 family protein n=1 Tax=Lentzea kristufekii TaxID=3095430 RepID=A0ABU4TIV4_9PSEU|nr:Hsp70 family protein [Lentzea sp. BCCO 10_0798]MDX8047907.1 Hsp70 family protein [Lentzea sp. BCCO 10_0798]
MSYQVGLDLGSAGTTVATSSGVTTSSRRQQAQAREIAYVLDDLAHRHGEPPSRVAMTHPLCWPHEHLEQLRQDLINEGRADVLFVPAPHAAAIAFDADAQMPEHSTVAVFDFGATGCDVTVLRKQGVLLLAGQPERVEVGGFDLDELVAEHVIAKIGTHSRELVRSCVEAKELLGSYPEVRIPYVATNGEVREVRLSRLEFEAVIRPSVEMAIDALERGAGGAGLCLPDVILLVGGSSRIPLVAREITERLHIPVMRAPDGAAATGAYLEARQLEPEPAEQATVEVPLPRQEDQEKRIPTTPFIAAGLLVLVLGGGWFAHDAMNQPQVRMENTSVQLEPPGTAELPRISEPGR